jgi:hypothetical protein
MFEDTLSTGIMQTTLHFRASLKVAQPFGFAVNIEVIVKRTADMHLADC